MNSRLAIFLDITKLEKTNLTKKVPFKGQTKICEVYRIPIDTLFYNDLNGRIATWISEYDETNPYRKISTIDDVEEYNNIIAEFIRETNGRASFQKTKNDIKSKGQQEIGVVLDSGRIIDGNRRFTCLRDLFIETNDQRFRYFEAIIFTSPKSEDDRKAIKSMELELQQGVDEKIGYNPVDRMVDAYRDLIEEQLYTDNEYMRLTNLKPAEFRTLKEKAKIMADLLHFFNYDKKWFLVKKMNLDGPIQELLALKKKIANHFEWDDIKSYFYAFLMAPNAGDKTRIVRDMAKQYLTDKKAFLSQYAPVIENAFEAIVETVSHVVNVHIDSSDSTDIHSANNNHKSESNLKKIEEMTSEVKVITTNGKQQLAKDAPIREIISINKSLSEIDIDLVERYDQIMQKRFTDELVKLEEQINRIKDRL